MKRFDLTPEAVRDLQEIWGFIAERSLAAADRVLEEFHVAFGKLAETPGMGHRREDLTSRDVLFWAVYSYLVIYRRSSGPVLIVAVLHGRRDVSRLLNER